MECWVFKRDEELVLFGLMKKQKFPAMFMGIMWEVKNGIHLYHTRVSMSLANTSPSKMLDHLLCLQSIDLSRVKMGKRTFTEDTEDLFWKFIEDSQMSKVIGKSRLTKKVEQSIMKKNHA